MPRQNWEPEWDELRGTMEELEKKAGELEAQLREEGFVLKSRSQRDGGTISNFVCKYAARKGYKHCGCKKRIDIDTSRRSGPVMIFEWNQREHLHEEFGEQSIRFKSPVKKVINDCANDGVQTMRCMQRLKRELGMENLTPKQVSCALYTARKKQRVGESWSTDDLSVWMDEHAFKEDIEVDKVFAGSAEMPQTEGGDGFWGVFLTTRTMIGRCMGDVVHVDGMYSKELGKYPVLMVGVPDKDQHMHVLGVAVTANETSKAYSFLLKSVRNCVKRVLGVDWAAGLIVGMETRSVSNGIREVVGNKARRGVCQERALKCIEDKLSLIENIDRRKEVMEAVQKLALAPSDEDFARAKMLLYVWLQRELGFRDFLYSSWLDGELGTFYEGFTKQGPSSNAGFKPFCRSVKVDIKNNRSVAVGSFLDDIVPKLEAWSLAVKEQPFVKEVTITPSDLLAVTDWRNKQPRIMCIPGCNNVLYVRPSSCSSEAEWKPHVLPPKTWGEYVKQRSSQWVLTKKSVGGDWMCSCPSFVKLGKCKHCLSLNGVCRS